MRAHTRMRSVSLLRMRVSSQQAGNIVAMMSIDSELLIGTVEDGWPEEVRKLLLVWLRLGRGLVATIDQEDPALLARELKTFDARALTFLALHALFWGEKARVPSHAPHRPDPGTCPSRSPRPLPPPIACFGLPISAPPPLRPHRALRRR